MQIQFCAGNSDLGSLRATFEWSVQLPAVKKAGVTSCRIVTMEFDGAVEPLVKPRNSSCKPYFHVSIFFSSKTIRS